MQIAAVGIETHKHENPGLNAVIRNGSKEDTENYRKTK